MPTLRRPTVAGAFYPADPRELRRMVKGYVEAADASGPVPKAIIAPHAGYIYSGPIAGSAYAKIISARDTITRVVLLGPSHRVPFLGLAVCNADAYTTPLGNVTVDKDAVKLISDLPQVQVLDQAHALEHSLEVQLPFLQEVLSDFALVPIVVGEATDEEVAEALDRLWGGPETLVVISSDLTHYLDYETARKLDKATSRAIEQLQPDRISHEHACGHTPIRGLLCAARGHGLKAATVDLRSSGDTAGPRDQVVGYGAYVFT